MHPKFSFPCSFFLTVQHSFSPVTGSGRLPPGCETYQENLTCEPSRFWGKTAAVWKSVFPGLTSWTIKKHVRMCRPYGSACGYEKSPRFAWAVNRSPHVPSHLGKFHKGKSTAFQVNDKKKNVKRIKITERKNNMIFLIDPLQDMKILIIFVVSK